jgi:diguanylate cyclase (GGDEF)-like protein
LGDEGAINSATTLTAHLEAQDQAENAYFKALSQMRDKVMYTLGSQGDKGTASEITKAFNGHMDLISSSRAHTVEETQGFVQEMRSVAERAKTNSTKLLDLWSELDLGTPPPDLNKQILLSKGWDMTRVKVATSWEAHFGDSIKSSEAIHGLFTNSGADITDLEALYNDAVDKTTYAQSLRSALYNGGMIYSDKEASALNVINKSRLAGEDPVLGLRKVLKEFDVGTVVGDATGPRGASMDRQALATINKFLPDGEKFTSIDEAAANPEKAVQGLLARGKANGSLFDLKGIQSLPVQALEEDVPDLQRISAQLKEANSKISSLEVKLDINKTDPMTKLPILKRQPELAANAQHFGYIDVRGMKTVNDSLGHAQGDEMIKQFGSILRDIQSENPGVTIARKYGEGDEFVVMFDKNDPVAAKTLMDKINNEFHTSMIVLEDEHGNPVVKQGFSIWTGTGKTEKEADLSINAAKQAYTDATDQRVFTPGLRDVSPAEPGYDTAIAARNAAGADAAGAVHGTAEPAAAAGGTANAVPSGNATGVSELQGGGNSATGTPGVPEPPVNPQESAGRSQVVPPSRNGAYEPAVPPTALGAPQTVFNGYNHSKSGYMEMYDRLTQQVMDEWGQKTKSASGTLANEQKLAEFVHGDLADKMETARAVSLKSAEYWRDFAMHSYGSKTYADLALSYVMPYHFWYDRTYLNWAKRLTTDPQIIAAYAKYKRLMENVNATSPDWWKYNISTDLLGIDLKNPIFLNLEQAVWPLQGLTGVDFNDPYKRVDWLTSTIDDLGKFGPNVWGPIQMAVAGNLMMQGENDAAARWGGRLIPQTATLKSALALTGVNLASLPNKGELDPNVNFFAHGKDPYEQAQIGRALGSLVGKDFQGTTVTQEMADDAARQGDGPLWDKALQDAVSMRAPGKLASFMLGVGFKARTTDDMQIDKFYSEYRGVKAIWNTLNADDRRNTMDALRVKYPFMDTVLISRMGSTDRDMAYSYNVLSRIPPGQKSQLLQQAGIDQSVLDQFYASKSTDPFSGMTATDKDRFMAGIVDLGAMLKLPSDATQTEWNQAISQYTNFLTQSQAQYGNSVWDEVTEYYALYNPKDSNVADTYLQNHPEVNQAIMAREQFKISNPLVYKYYGSMNTVWSYYSSWVYGELNKKYGADMSQKENDYYNEALTNPNAVKTPEMKAYDKDKIALFDQANKMAVNLVDHMPLNNTGYAVRPDFKPQSVDQMNLRNAALPVNDYPSWTDWQSIMSPSEQNLVMAYFTKNQPLSYSAQSQLTYDMRTFGFTNVNKALEAIGVALSKP